MELIWGWSGLITFGVVLAVGLMAAIWVMLYVSSRSE